MRFLHTSDWHLGRQMRGLSRQDEFVAVLQEVADIARSEQVDAVIVAGDVFDSFAPPEDAERLLYETLASLLGEGIKTVMIAGNHDHAGRMDALSGILRLAGIHSTGGVPQDASGAVRLQSRDKSETATIVALPWVPERKAIDFERLFEAPEESLKQYSDRLDVAMRHLSRAFQASTVNLFVGHMLIDGVVIGEGSGERKLHIGQNFAVKSQTLPEAAQYIALGHVHRPQEVRASAPARYSGSLLQLDFGESGQQKSVTIVDVRPGLPADVRTVRLSKGRALRNVTLKLEDLAGAKDAYGDDYLRVTVELDRPHPRLYEQVREVLPNAVDVTALLPEGASGEQEAQERRDLGPEELLARYYRLRKGADISPELLAIFRDLYQQESEHAAAEA